MNRSHLKGSKGHAQRAKSSTDLLRMIVKMGEPFIVFIKASNLREIFEILIEMFGLYYRLQNSDQRRVMALK